MWCVGKNVQLGTRRGQKRVLDPLELELKVVTSHLSFTLTTKLKSSLECSSLLSHFSSPINVLLVTFYSTSFLGLKVTQAGEARVWWFE